MPGEGGAGAGVGEHVVEDVDESGPVLAGELGEPGTEASLGLCRWQAAGPGDRCRSWCRRWTAASWHTQRLACLRSRLS